MTQEDAEGGITEDPVAAALGLAVAVGQDLPLPGSGHTRRRWHLMEEIAADDVTVARVVEPHVDALAILAEAGLTAPEGSAWGVFAAEGPGEPVRAVPAPPREDPNDGEPWTLTGRKPWCSLADRLSHALVTAHTPQGRRLFSVDLRHPGVRVVPGAWHARGLSDVPSGPVDLDDVPATPVGEAGWYLERPGFAHGGIGVAACWFGGAAGVARRLLLSAGQRDPDQVAQVHLGRVALVLSTARLHLDDAARAVDAGEATGDAGERLALRVRTAVVVAAETVISEVGHALGPAPLALDADHARRVADLTLYLRQHHAERDVARLGSMVLAQADERCPW